MTPRSVVNELIQGPISSQTLGYVGYIPTSIVTGLIQDPISSQTLGYVGYSPMCVVTGLNQGSIISQWKWLTFLFPVSLRDTGFWAWWKAKIFLWGNINLSAWCHSFWIKEIKKILIQKLLSPHLCFYAMTTISYTQPLLTNLII